MVKEAHEVGGVDSPFDLTFLEPSKFYHASDSTRDLQGPLIRHENASTYPLPRSTENLQVISFT